ncbi:NB-ARC domain-containing protein [Nostoc sp.]|uniref:NB-ARC domain-containing protein n=1 Tax=Nostoc sp. TaxID=1180 RepID=UPI002FF6CDE5
MPRSLKVSQEYIGKVKLAIRRNGFASQKALAEDVGLALATVSNFLSGKPVSQETFEELCQKLALDCKEIADLSFSKQEEANGDPSTRITRELNIPPKLSHVLHLSDLHFGTTDNARSWYAQLAEDLRYELSCSHLDALIISGDIASKSTTDEYAAAQLFINRLSQEFKLESQQIVIVPGNHDVNWQLSEAAYSKINTEYSQESIEEYLTNEKGEFIEGLDGEQYKQRFINFSRFYEAIKGELYPLQYDQQHSLQHLPDQNLLILGLNSAWQIDHRHNKYRASINLKALSNALSLIRRNPTYEDCLKIAVWHHSLNTISDDRIHDTGLMEQLAAAGFRLVLHGGVHRNENNSYHYEYSTSRQQINIIGAGVFGTSLQELVSGYPWQYNFLKIEASKVTVETRCREEPNGVWKPDALWNQGDGLTLTSHYVITLDKERESLQRTLNRARRALQILEEEKASYGIRVPVDLQIELEEKQKEVTSLEARLSQLQGQRPESLPDNLPRYNDEFVGRKQEIARCLEALSQEDRNWGVAIDGIGGIGKTALALEVAHLVRQQAMFDAYLFVSAKTTWLSAEGVRQETLALSSLDSFCREFAKGLGHADIVKMTDATQRRSALLDALRGRRALLIWDNLETLNAEERDMIAEFVRKLPTPNKAIITSRRRTGESALTIRLDRLLESEALELMQAKGRSHPRLAQELNATKPEILTALYQASGGNPLALDWTLGQVAHKGYSISVALERLRNAAKSADLYGFLFADAAQTLSVNDRKVLSALAEFLTPVTIVALADATDLALTEIQVSLEQLVTLSLVNNWDGERFGLHPLTRTYIRATLGRTDTIETSHIDGNPHEVGPKAPFATNTYSLIVLISNTQLTVGQRSRLQVNIEPVTSKEENSFQIPAHIPELQCFVSADGLQVVDLEAAIISIDPETGHPLPASFELQGYLRGTRTYSIELFVEDPESGKLSIFKYEGQIIVNPPRASEESLSIPPTLPTLNISVAPQANFVLLVETELPDGNDGSYFFTYYLTSRLRDLKLRQQKVGKVELQSNQLKRMRSLLARTLQFATNAKPEDAREQMISVGYFLFDMLLPTETTALLRDAFWQVAEQISTWLIIEDGITWLPWELIVPYRDDDYTMPRRFLCERYFLSRWIQGLGIPLYNEVPLGEIAITHYKVLDTQDEEIEAWKQLLQASVAPGIRQAVNPETPFYGLHLLRYAEEFNRRDIVARDAVKSVNTPEEEVPKARLDLRLKRPIVTFSIINNNDDVLQNTGELTIVERVLPFLRVGASAVVGCCWQTSEVAERIFWSQFYELLAKGFSLGEVVWRSRLAVERALPHRLDWLAYTLFGDPCAKPYEPEVSSGYSVLECLNPDEPFRVGKTYYFRASIRKRPPVWYKEKLIKTEQLSNQLRALFMAPGLQTSFPEPVEMQPIGHHMRQATLSLNPQQEGDYPLLVQILEGEELVKTLQLNLKVREQANG